MGFETYISPIVESIDTSFNTERRAERHCLALDLQVPEGTMPNVFLHLFFVRDDIYYVFNPPAYPSSLMTAIALTFERIYTGLYRSPNPGSEEPRLVSPVSYTAITSGKVV